VFNANFSNGWYHRLFLIELILYTYDKICVTMIKYIIHKVQDDIVLYCNTVYSELYASVGILLTRGKHFYDRTISLIKEVWTNKTSIEVHVQTRKVSSIIFVC
jgi:hypothetical protein